MCQYQVELVWKLNVVDVWMHALHHYMKHFCLVVKILNAVTQDWTLINVIERVGLVWLSWNTSKIPYISVHFKRSYGTIVLDVRMNVSINSIPKSIAIYIYVNIQSDFCVNANITCKNAIGKLMHHRIFHKLPNHIHWMFWCSFQMSYYANT